MTDEERERKQATARRIRRGVIVTGMIGTLGVTGLVAAQTATEASTTVVVQDSTSTGSSSPQQWSVQGPSSGSGSLGSAHAATGGS